MLDQFNKGNIDGEGNHLPPQPKNYVDNAMVCAVWYKMSLALMCLLHAIFTVCGQPEEHLRQCPLALDKWEGMVVSYKAILLGLVINSRDMTVSMTKEYVAELHKILNKTWHGARKTFHLNELEILLGKFAQLGESVTWIFRLLTHMYCSTAFALQANREHLAENSPSFGTYIKRIKQLHQEQTSETKRNIAHINFALKKSAQQVHWLKHKYHINKCGKQLHSIQRFPGPRQSVI